LQGVELAIQLFESGFLGGEAQGVEGGDAARRVEGMDDEILYVFSFVICYEGYANAVRAD